MKHPLQKFSFIAALATTLCAIPANAATAKPLRILLLDGQSGGPYHEWRQTTPILKRELEETGRFVVTVATAPEFPGGDFTAFNPAFAGYAAVVSNYDAPDWPAPLRDQLDRYVSGGGGLVIVHAADNAFPDWTAFNKMAGLGGWRERTEHSGEMWYYKDGKLVSDASPGSAGSHGARLPFQVETRAPEHPIMRGLPRVWMHNADELYATLRGPAENMTILATAHSDPANKGTGHDEPILMVTHYGKGRVFHTTLGHDSVALSCIGFITTFQRGTEWAANGKVTQRVPTDFPGPHTSSYRVDIAEMDPAYALHAPITAAPGAATAQAFEGLADSTLAAMRKRAVELNITGVAVAAYFDGDTIQSWTSKMAVVGRMKDLAASEKGNNLLAIAYAKASEMADTLKDSGSNVRPPMTGEFGWQGGAIARVKTGYVICAFSGGKSEDDLQVSRTGLALLKAAL